MIVRHVEERLGRGIDEAILLPDREDVLIQAQLLKRLVADASHSDALRSLDVGVGLAELVEEITNLDHLLVSIPARLIAKEIIEGLQLVELENVIVVQISCHEDLIDVLKLLSLELVGCVDDELGEIVQLDCLSVRVQVQVLLLQRFRDRNLLLSNLCRVKN